MKVGSAIESSAMEEALDSEVAPVSEMAMDSVEMVPDAVQVAPDSVDMVPDSVEVVPESLCARCGMFHADNDDDGCYQARHEGSRCACCSIVHRDYDLTTWILDGTENFDYELYIPYVEKLQTDGDTILLPKHVIKKLDEIYNMKKLEDAKIKQDEKKEQ
jgi:hypothetical protein